MRSSKVVLNIVNSVLSILLLVLILFVVLKAGNAAYDLGYRIFTEPAMEREPGRDISVRYYDGMSLTELGSLLEEKGLVDSGIVFAIQLRLFAGGDKIRPGKYTLNTSWTPEELIQVLAGEDLEETEE